MKDSAYLKLQCSKAIELLKSGSIDLLASQYGYALAFERPAYQAISEDLNECLAAVGSTGFSNVSKDSEITVNFLTENSAGIEAAIECVVETNSGTSLLVEFVSTAHGLSLEQISTAA
jgi:hypothetical protein